MSFAVGENAVIFSDDGRQVRYHARCPYCGHVATNTTYTHYLSQGIIANVGMHTCFQCHKSFGMRLIRR